jgi:hypothetical protein
MDSEHKSGQETNKAEKQGRGWTSRFTGPIRYRRFTDIDAGGKQAILFKFELAPGQQDLPQEVYDILNELKHLKRSPEHGGGQQHTNLAFNRSKKHGRVWRLDDNPTGRTVADIIDAKLKQVAEKIEQKPTEPHR